MNIYLVTGLVLLVYLVVVWFLGTCFTCKEATVDSVVLAYG